jgi:transcriptional regulator with XRE-family HTH domain
LRIKRHLTVSALAVRSGVNATQISRYENDQAIPVPLTVEKLATALNVNITELTDAALPSRAIGVSSATQRGNDEEM